MFSDQIGLEVGNVLSLQCQSRAEGERERGTERKGERKERTGCGLSFQLLLFSPGKTELTVVR